MLCSAAPRRAFSAPCRCVQPSRRSAFTVRASLEAGDKVRKQIALRPGLIWDSQLPRWRAAQDHAGLAPNPAQQRIRNLATQHPTTLPHRIRLLRR